MTSLADYEAWKARRQQASAGAANVVLSQDFEDSPDAIASDMQLGQELAKTTGGPVPPVSMTREYRPLFQQMVERDRNTSILSSSPMLTEWLRTPDNAAIARDDLENLNWFETIIRNVGAGTAQGTTLPWNQWLSDNMVRRAADANRSFGDILADELAIRDNSGAVIGSKHIPNPLDLYNSIARMVTARVSDFAGEDAQAKAAYYQQQAGIIAKQISDTPMASNAARFAATMQEHKASGDFATDAGTFFQQVANDPVGASDWLAHMLARLAPQIAVSSAIEAVTRNPAIGATTMGAASYAQERYGAPSGFFQERGIDITTPEGAMQVISSPELMQAAAQRGEIRGTIISVLGGLSGGVASQTLLKSPMGEVAIQTLAQGLMAGYGEFEARRVAGQEMSAVDIILQGLLVGVTAVPQVMGITGRAILRNQAKARAAEQRVAVFKEMTGQAVNSRVRARLPEKFRDFLTAVTANGPIENLYVPADKFVEYFRSRGIDPFEIADNLSGMSRADVQTALETGGHVQLPMASWATDMAGGAHDQFIMENSAFSPDDMTSSEAAEFKAHAAELMQEGWEQAAAIRQDDERVRAIYDLEHDQLVGSLQAAGRSTEIATAEALPMLAFRRTMAERMGVTPEEFAALYPLPKVEGERPAGLDPKNFEALTHTLAEARARRAARQDRGQSLLEFISERGGIDDPGGELAARDASVVKRDHGKKVLRLARGGLIAGMKDMLGGDSLARGFDDTARAAVEAGFMASDPDVMAWREAERTGTEAPDISRSLLAAIERELSGTPQYADGAEGGAAADASDGRDRLEEYLAGIGMSLENSDDEIKAAIEAREGEGPAYGQASVIRNALRALVEFARKGAKNETRTLEVGAVSPELARAVRDRTGLDIQGYTHTVDAFALRHVLNRHSDEKVEASRGQLPITEADLLAIPDMIANVREVITGLQSDIGRPIVAFIMTAPDGSVLYLEEALSGKKRLAALSMRKYPPATQSSSIAAALGRTSKTAPGIEVSIAEIEPSANSVAAGNPRLLFQTDGSGSGLMRGSIRFPAAGVAGGDTIVSLFKSADPSTFLHETGHYFLTVMGDMAARDPSGPIDQDFQTVKDWWHSHADSVAKDAMHVAPDIAVAADDVRMALEAGTTGNAALDRAIDAGMQEQFARAAEQYFMAGKAPSIELRGAFEKFKAWLISTYRAMAGLNIEMSDQMRGVFDRLMATDAEIRQARADIGADVQLSAADLGMTDQQHAALVRLHEQAKDEAMAKLLAETMAPIVRQREKWFKDERAKTRADVERNMNAQRAYRAIEWMGNRRWLGDAAPEGLPDMRFSRDILVDRYGADVLKTLPRGQQAVYAVDGGLDPDDVAGWFGFGSGDEMIRAMEQTPKRIDAIEAETDRLMSEKHGDVLRDGSVEKLALKAVHNDKRAEALAGELKALNEIAGTDPELTARDARDLARRRLSSMKTRDALRADRFLAAERKAAQQVARLSGTVTREGIWMDRARRRIAKEAHKAVQGGDAPATLEIGAGVDRANQSTGRFNEQAAALVEAKRRQLLNHAMYAEAQAIADEVASAERLVARLNKSVARRHAQAGKQTISQAISIDHLDAIAELIERYDFRHLSGPAEDRRGALLRYVASMTEQGRENELAIPKAVLEEAGRVPYKTLTVENLRGLVDTLRNLESTGRRWQKLLIARKQREMAEAVDTIVTGLRQNIGKGERAWGESGWLSAGKGAVNQYLSTFLTAGTIIRQMDGRADLGPVYELLKSDIDDAAYAEREMLGKAAGEIEQIYAVYSHQEQRQMAVRKAVPGLGGQSFSKWNLIAMALNMGNEGNFHRLTNPRARRSLTPAQVEVVKAALDKRDWDFVQSVWDYLDTYRPLIAERQKRVTGVEPEWVEARAVQTPHGTYRGGYYPIKYERRPGSALTPAINPENDITESMRAGSYSKAATRNGHLEARNANVQQSLLLDVGVIASHTNEVIHDLTFSEPIVNTWRLLNDKRLGDAMIDAGMQEQHEALKLWVKDAAVGQVFASDFMSRAVRNLRSGFTVSRLAFNLGTAMLQPAGLMQSASAVGKRNLANAIIAYSRNPLAVTGEIVSKSRVMGERRTTFQKDLMDMVAQTSISSPTSSRFKDLMNRYAVPASLAAMTYTQFYLVDVPTWAAAYDKGMATFEGNQKKAAEYADMTINRVGGSGLWTERSGIERGTLSSTVRQNALVTLFTTLGSYFFAKMNLLIERTDGLRAEPITAGAAASYAFDVALLLAGEAAVMMLGGAIKGAVFGDDDDEEEDKNPAMTLGTEALKVFAAGLPGIRDGMSVMQGFSGGTYAGVLDLLVKPARQAAQGEFDAALVNSFVNLGGVALRLPAAQANRIIDAGWRDLEGEDVAPMEYLFGRSR